MSLSISSNLKSASTPDIIWSLALFLMIVTVAMYNIYASCFWCNLRYFLKGSVSQYCVSKLKNSSTFLVHSNPRSLGKTCIYLKCRQCTHKHTHIGPQTNKHQEGMSGFFFKSTGVSALQKGEVRGVSAWFLPAGVCTSKGIREQGCLPVLSGSKVVCL